MAKEKFLIVASQCHDDCFGRFSETANREAIEAGTVDTNDAYSWIEASFEIRLIRWREATHLCSFTPSTYYVWMKNYFVGFPHSRMCFDSSGLSAFQETYFDYPEGLERENGGEWHGYATYHDDYDPRFICAEFTVDSMRDLEEPMRKPREKRHAMTTGDHGEASEAYHKAIWKRAEEIAFEMGCNTDWSEAPILNAYTFRQWERERLEKARQRSLEDSKRPYRHTWQNDLLAPVYEAQARAARPNLFAE